MGEPRSSQHSRAGSHGGEARKPSSIPFAGWKQILKRLKDRIALNHLSIISAGVAFFLLLGVIPALAALISIYGLISDPGEVVRQIGSLTQGLPESSRQLLQEQMNRLASQDSVAGFGALIGILVALWSGSKSMNALIDALNIVYREEETRGFIRVKATAIGLTLAAVVTGLIALGLIAVLPAVINQLGLSAYGEQWVSILRWPLLALIAISSTAALYRYAPDRHPARWRWLSWGAVVASLLWLGVSALFSLYVSHFGSYNKAYGSLGAVVVLIMWLYLSAFVLLLGAQLDAEMEHQTEIDTTKGKARPMGERGACVADTSPHRH